jgi:hypothetical protein
MPLMKRKDPLAAGQEIPKHEYNEGEFCIHCGLARTFLESTEMPCLSQSERAIRLVEIKRRKVEQREVAATSAALSAWRQRAQELLEQGAEPMLAYARMIAQHLILHSPPGRIRDIKATATARTVTLQVTTAGDQQWLVPMVFALTERKQINLELYPNIPEQVTLRLKVSASQLGWPRRERARRAKKPSIGWHRAPGSFESAFR